MSEQSINQNALFDWIKTKASEKFKNTGSQTTEQDVQNIVNSIMSNGFSISGSVNGTGSGEGSYVSSSSSEGYSSDISSLKGDLYKTMTLLNEVASHVEDVEARLSSLEIKMRNNSIGGINDWYDGGSIGNNGWDIDEWYKTGDVDTSSIDEIVSINFDLSNVEPDQTGLVFIDVFDSTQVDWFDYSAIDKLSVKTSISFTCNEQPLKGVNVWFLASDFALSDYNYTDCYIENAVGSVGKIKTVNASKTYSSQVLPRSGYCKFLISVEATGTGAANISGKITLNFKANLRAI